MFIVFADMRRYVCTMYEYMGKKQDTNKNIEIFEHKKNLNVFLCCCWASYIIIIDIVCTPSNFTSTSLHSSSTQHHITPPDSTPSGLILHKLALSSQAKLLRNLYFAIRNVYMLFGKQTKRIFTKQK